MTEIKFGAGVITLVFNKDLSKILLIKRNEEKRVRWGFDWGNLGGKLDFREYSIDGAIREAKEEANLDLDKKQIRFLEIIEYPNWSDSYHSFHFIYGISIDENEAVTINEESDEFQWFDINNLPNKMIDKPEDIKKWLEIFREIQ
jgi:8-oxo-dGTP pyrophosphatase MutT (NUDIX family)